MIRLLPIKRLILAMALTFGMSICVAANEPQKESGRLNQGNIFRLSLDEVTNLAIANNFDIQLAKYDAWIAQTRNDVAESIYDAVLDAEINYRNDQNERSTTFNGSKSLDNNYNAGLSQKFPTGTTVSIDADHNRSWSNSSFVTTNPAHDTSLGVTVKQELGKNFLGIQNRGNIKITKLEIANSEFTSLRKIEDDISRVQKAYWELVLQNERVLIEQDMVTQARKLFDLNEEKAQHGLVEAPDVLAAEAYYKERVNQLVLVENQKETAANVVRLHLNIADDSKAIAPSDKFNINNSTQELTRSLTAAFENRPDYKAAKNTIESRNIQLVMKENSGWPEINLTASLARNGVATATSDAYEAILDEDNPNFFAGLTFSMPLANRKAKAEFKAAELQKARALLSLKYLERQISIAIVDQVRTCNVFKELAINALSIAELQEKKLAAEEKRYRRGRSSTDTIIRFQEDLISARWEAAQAKYRYHEALIDLRVKEGTLLKEYWDGEKGIRGEGDKG